MAELEKDARSKERPFAGMCVAFLLNNAVRQFCCPLTEKGPLALLSTFGLFQIY